MFNSRLSELIENFQKGDMDAFQTINLEFEGLISFYSKKLGGEDYFQELEVFLLELLRQIKISTFDAYTNDGLKRYIAVSIRNRYISLSKEKQKTEFLSSDIYEKDLRVDFKPANKLITEEMLGLLSKKQRQVITYKYIYGYSDAEIAEYFKISRQAVNRLKIRAIEIMREYYISSDNVF